MSLLLKKSMAEMISVMMSAESRPTLKTKKNMTSWQCLNTGLLYSCFNLRQPETKIKYILEQELLGQFSSTVEQKLYHWEWRNNDGKINLKFKSKGTNKIRGKN